MVEKVNTPEDKEAVTPLSTEEKKAAEVAASVKATDEAAAVKAKTDAEAAAKVAADTAKNLPKTDEEKAAEEEAKANAEVKPLDTDTFGDTGSEVGNSVLQLMQNAGADVEQSKALLFEAVQKNDMSLIDRAALVDVVGEASATIIISGTATFAAEIAKTQAAVTEAVYSVAGNKENWATVTAWADTALTDTEMADYNDLITKGGVSARFAATELLTKFNSDGKNTQIMDTPRVNADVDTTTTSEAITQKQYYAAVVAARRRGEDLTAIKAARARGRAKGI